ncbi:MAG: Gfo/Idh/MocA family oxidoreductase [Pirellulales bacterium]|nr:Gfo/Idh/MocA family oxidoreductase [Pirellulales bacterium]
MLNRRDCLKWSAAGFGLLASGRAPAAAANDRIRLGIIGLGWRGNELLDMFLRESGAEIRWLVDVDRERVDEAGKKAPQASRSQNLADVIESDDVDAVVIATCNHWHCLAAVRAIAAGKDVYVEKPLGQNVWEGRQVVAAARKHDRIVQLGTQQRSDPMQRGIREFLHEEQALGKILGVEVCRYGVRPSIGKQDAPLKPAASVDFDRWLGPAQDLPIYRPNLHYDWHWSWNTGNGEMGNWGVHLVDDVLNVVLRDSLALPRSVQAGGGRLTWNDAGETPNVHFARFDAGEFPVVFGLSNLPEKPGARGALKRHGVESGYIVSCEGGRYCGWRGGGVAVDARGKELRKFRGTSGAQEHVHNFLEAVRTRDRGLLNAEVAIGDSSTNWCHMANLAYRSGVAGGGSKVDGDDPAWHGMLGALGDHLQAHGIGLGDEQLRASGVLTIAADDAAFAGPNAEVANSLLQREYRAGYEFPTETA